MLKLKPTFIISAFVQYNFEHFSPALLKFKINSHSHSHSQSHRQSLGNSIYLVIYYIPAYMYVYFVHLALHTPVQLRDLGFVLALTCMPLVWREKGSNNKKHENQVRALPPAQSTLQVSEASAIGSSAHQRKNRLTHTQYL